MSKEKVYLETSVISYLTARPGRDVVTLAKQELTRQWWRESAARFDLYVSPPSWMRSSQVIPTQPDNG